MNSKPIYLHNSEIDTEKWDKTVDLAVNSRVYALSWYLDILDPDWHGLIYDDYQYVMPVIVSKKLWVEYAFQPVYAQQHGIFPPSTPDVTAQFVAFLKSKFQYFSISFNSLNLIEINGIEVENRKNYILSLKGSYSEISEKYTAHTLRYVKKAAAKSNLSTQISLEDYMNLKATYAKKTISETYMNRLKQIISHAMNKGLCKIYGCYDEHNQLVAAALFLSEKKRFTYLNSVSSPEGKQQRAMYAIVDAFIRNHAGQPFLLDFEGSNIEGIARFFAGFGATPEIYPLMKYNNLPWILKILKK